MQEQFFTAREILHNRPVTLLDFRKLLIDLEGVKNAWIVPASLSYYADTIHKKLLESDPGTPGITPVEIGGLYEVLIDYMGGLSKPKKSNVLDDVQEILQANRNLCEDFVGYSEVETEEFVLCGEFELQADANTAETMANILFEVQQYLAPAVQNYTLDEMLVKTKADGSACLVPRMGRIGSRWPPLMPALTPRTRLRILSISRSSRVPRLPRR